MNQRRTMIKPRIAETAARAHPHWDVLPGGRLAKKKGKPGPDTIEELEAWFEQNYPEEVAKLRAEAEELEQKMFGKTKH